MRSAGSAKSGASAFAGVLAAVGCAISIGLGITPLFMGIFPIFLKPVSDELGWNLSIFTQAPLVISLASAVAGPFGGRLVDRYGVRRVLPFGLVLSCAGLFLLSFVGQQPVGMYLAALLIGLGASIAGPISCAKVISGWFDKSRGLVLGLVLGAVPGISIAVAVQVAHGLIDLYGWRDSYRLLAIVAAAVTIPVAVLLIREAPVRSGAGPEVSTADGLTASQALRSRAFYLVVGSSCLVAAGLMAITDHIGVWATGQGISRDTIALALSLYSLIGLLGPLVGGFVMDRAPSPKVVSVIFLLPPIGMALLFLGGAPGLLTGMALLGLTFNSIGGSLPLLISRYFGPKAGSEILGSALAALAICMGVAPFLMGIGYVSTGGYAVPMTIVAGVLGVGFVVSLFFPDYRNIDHRDAVGEPRTVETKGGRT